jgi:phosphoglycerate dehydrogenase-like enzyme
MAGRDLTIETEEADGHVIQAVFTEPGDRIPDWVLPGCDALLNCRSRHALTADILARMTRCRLIVQGGVGFNHIDIAVAAELGIPVCNTPDYGTTEVADHAIALLLALSRGIPHYDADLRLPSTRWVPQRLQPVRRLRGLRAGVVGLGRIGLATAQRMRGFDLRIGFFDPYLAPGIEHALGFRRFGSLGELMAGSDVVSLHCPLTPATQGMVGADAMAALPDGAVLINTARGGLIDLDALDVALRSGRLAGAGLDVLPAEPIERDHPLVLEWMRGAEWLRGRLLVTPHVAFHAPESVADMRRLSMRTIAQYFRDGTLRAPVNEPLPRPRRPWNRNEPI